MPKGAGLYRGSTGAQSSAAESGKRSQVCSLSQWHAAWPGCAWRRGVVLVAELTLNCPNLHCVRLIFFRCSEELRQADEVEKDMLNCERSTLEAQIHTLRSERDSLAAENESLVRRETEREILDQDGEKDLQRAVEALRSSQVSARRHFSPRPFTRLSLSLRI